MAEEVGGSVTIVAMCGGEVGEHDAALLRARSGEAIECVREGHGRCDSVPGSKGGVAGEGVQSSGVVEVQPLRRCVVGVDRGSREVDLVPTRGTVAGPALDLGGDAVQPGPDGSG